MYLFMDQLCSREYVQMHMPHINLEGIKSSSKMKFHLGQNFGEGLGRRFFFIFLHFLQGMWASRMLQC